MCALFWLTLRAMRHSLNGLLAIGIITIGLEAQAPRLSDPHHAILDVSSLKPAAAVAPAGEEGFKDLAGATIHKDLETIVGFSKADRARGEMALGRITGFRGADETHAWVLQQFKAAGLRDAETQTYTATQPTWHPKK